MFKTMGRTCTDYFLTSISTIVASYFESVRFSFQTFMDQANNEMRSKLGSIVGIWARQRTFPEHVINDIIVCLAG